MFSKYGLDILINLGVDIESPLLDSKFAEWQIWEVEKELGLTRNKVPDISTLVELMERKGYTHLDNDGTTFIFKKIVGLIC
jgi:hypothetical protein